MDEDEALLLKVAEAAHQLNVSVRHIYRLIDAGILKPVKLGRSLRITRKSIRQAAGQ